jgi:hypothetical protein
VSGILAGTDSGSDRHKLDQLLAPGVSRHFEADTDDAVRAEGIGLLFHAGDRKLARMVHRLGDCFQFHALIERPLSATRHGRYSTP